MEDAFCFNWKQIDGVRLFQDLNDEGEDEFSPDFIGWGKTCENYPKNSSIEEVEVEKFKINAVNINGNSFFKNDKNQNIFKNESINKLSQNFFELDLDKQANKHPMKSIESSIFDNEMFYSTKISNEINSKNSIKYKIAIKNFTIHTPQVKQQIKDLILEALLFKTTSSTTTKLNKSILFSSSEPKSVNFFTPILDEKISLNYNKINRWSDKSDLDFLINLSKDTISDSFIQINLPKKEVKVINISACFNDLDLLEQELNIQRSEVTFYNETNFPVTVETSIAPMINLIKGIPSKFFVFNQKKLCFETFGFRLIGQSKSASTLFLNTFLSQGTKSFILSYIINSVINSLEFNSLLRQLFVYFNEVLIEIFSLTDAFQKLLKGEPYVEQRNKLLRESDFLSVPVNKYCLIETYKYSNKLLPLLDEMFLYLNIGFNITRYLETNNFLENNISLEQFNVFYLQNMLSFDKTTEIILRNLDNLNTNNNTKTKSDYTSFHQDLKNFIMKSQFRIFITSCFNDDFIPTDSFIISNSHPAPHYFKHILPLQKKIKQMLSLIKVNSHEYFAPAALYSNAFLTLIEAEDIFSEFFYNTFENLVISSFKEKHNIIELIAAKKQLARRQEMNQISEMRRNFLLIKKKVEVKSKKK